MAETTLQEKLLEKCLPFLTCKLTASGFRGHWEEVATSEFHDPII